MRQLNFYLIAFGFSNIFKYFRPDRTVTSPYVGIERVAEAIGEDPLCLPKAAAKFGRQALYERLGPQTLPAFDEDDSSLLFAAPHEH